jgi:AbrB family looped-hinge helix DNA binding protein
MHSTITERGQISIPAKLRKKFQLKPGMGVIWLEREAGIFLMPIPEDPIRAFQDESLPITIDDLLKSRRSDRLKEK